MTCPPDHAHGETQTCRALHHCKCDDCRRGAREYEFWRAAQKRRGKALLLDARGTQRRIRALHRIGYSQRAVAAMCDRREAWVTHLMRVEKVKPATAELIARVYKQHSMVVPTPADGFQKGSISRAKRYAEKQGWPGPLDWEDIDNDPEPTTADQDTDRSAWMVDELAHFHSIGESPDYAVKQLGRQASTLSQLCYRHDRDDLGRWVAQAERRAA